MNALLSQALVTVGRAYEERGAGSGGLPTLPVWSNVLRPVGDGIEVRDLPASARLSRRAVRAAVGSAVRRGWLVEEGSTVRPSPAGRTARERWPALEAHVAAAIGSDLAGPLRDLVRRLDLEWPHFPSGYGPADHSITGGVHTPGAGRTDPVVPAHAADWAPAARYDVDGSTVEGLPLSALLSQALVAFSADFEEHRIAALHLSATVLRLLRDEGVPVREIPMLSRLKGDGKSVLERHGYLTIRPRADAPAVRLAVPTARGRNARDQYEPTVARVEHRWEARYGADVAGALRSALEAIDVDRSLPHSVIDSLT